MIVVLSHPACALHEGGVGHPERPERLEAVRLGVEAAGLGAELDEQEAPGATREQLQRVHTREHVEGLFDRSPAEGLVQLDPDTAMGPGSLRAAVLAAGACVRAVELVTAGSHAAAFCNVRPPGHHAERARAMGFCLFNNIAVGTAHALARGSKRVAIADFDVHHGNGTEDAFRDDTRVLLLSSFQRGIYPNPPMSTAANVVMTPLEPGSGSTAFRTTIERDWLPRLETFRPDLLMISAGFDAHARDPLADLRLQADDYHWVTRRLCETTACPIVSTLEGGYDLRALAESTTAHLTGLHRRQAPGR